MSDRQSLATPAAPGSGAVRGALLWVIATAPLVGLLLQLPAGGWWAMLGYHAGCVVAARALGFTWGRRPAAAEIVAWMALTTFGVALVAWQLPLIGELLQRARPLLEGWGMQGTAAGVAFGWYVLVNPWIEEGFWRGALLSPAIQQRLGRGTAITVATLGFVPYHSVVIHLMFGVEAWWFSAPILLGSAMWTGMTLWRRSVVPAAVSHLVADAAIVILYVRSLADGP